MRKINKSIRLSGSYFNWELNQRCLHPKYNSSNGAYYWDIVMNLFHCQDGLCAYTEMRLCDSEFYDVDNWNNETYKYDTTPEVDGQLEHFDSRLKLLKGWLWDNLFMVDTTINTKVKRTNQINPIFKPDSDGYDEFTTLFYDHDKHIFIPNPNLSPLQQVEVKLAIKHLGINYGPVKRKRRCYIETALTYIRYNVNTWSDIHLDEFPTAFEMIRRKRFA